MHRRAREHVGLVVKRKLMRRQHRIISGITGGWRNYLHGLKSSLVQLYQSEWQNEEDISRTFRSK